MVIIQAPLLQGFFYNQPKNKQPVQNLPKLNNLLSNHPAPKKTQQYFSTTTSMLWPTANNHCPSYRT